MHSLKGSLATWTTLELYRRILPICLVGALHAFVNPPIQSYFLPSSPDYEVRLKRELLTVCPNNFHRLRQAVLHPDLIKAQKEKVDNEEIDIESDDEDDMNTPNPKPSTSLQTLKSGVSRIIPSRQCSS